jgi:STE24 endopeptidase
MNWYLVFILAVIGAQFVLETVADWLNVRHVQEELPEEFEGYYDDEKYRTSQRYLRDTTYSDMFADTVKTAVVVTFILCGGFNYVDQAARSLGGGTVVTGLVFAGILTAASRLMALPFAAYDTFVIEERYGFNKTTPATFLLDEVKVLFLTAALGGPLFALVLWFFEYAAGTAWLYCWGLVVAFEMVMVFVAPYVILPLFNKYEPLEEGELKSAIEAYARSQGFAMKGVFTMDGSKRSSKSNAFFTGFGRSRRIVLFDTLIARHSVEEIVAILAHEMGHYKKRHVLWSIVRAVAAAGVSFYLLSFFINNRGLFEAFQMEHVSVYAGLFFFGFLFATLGRITTGNRCSDSRVTFSSRITPQGICP